MNMQPNEIAANIDDELKVFVRPSPQELEPTELDRVAGGARPLWVPDG